MKWHNDYDVSIPGWSSEGNHREPEKNHSCISLQLTISSQQIVQRKLTFLPNFYLLPLQSQNLWPRVSPLVQVQGFYTLQQTIRFRWYRFYALSHAQKLDIFISCYFRQLEWTSIKTHHQISNLKLYKCSFKSTRNLSPPSSSSGHSYRVELQLDPVKTVAVSLALVNCTLHCTLEKSKSTELH